MATQSLLAPHLTHTFSSDPSNEVAMSTEQHTIDNFESTEQQRPAQPSPIDLLGYEGLVWRNVAKQRFRIPENDRPRLDSWSPESHKKRKLEQYLKGYDAATAVENSALAGFNLLEFRALLLQWVIADNIAFRKVESPL
ncbi:hypothetical protein KC343_g6742 [Hortaea werneckii]|nr:hypothetical protein KC361_g8802 [Hortaea werneckii]KAI7076630.1 hypothetical protein KC339_g13816 [Hortaea werneckii]KAI7226181.1 hypothetical protein KC365_g9535 [Hortaea werneckii]KAI7291782.1 hypothetical protein KC352_g2538 [Hortaea werneckii]KAI7572996.1 hypothetical protein KC317_g266 [Hortaea werneckii]